MFFNSADIKRYAVQIGVFLCVGVGQMVYFEVRDTNARLDEPIIEQHGTFVMEQYDTLGRTNISTPYGDPKKMTLDPALPMAPQVKRKLGLWDLDITRTATVEVLAARGELRRTTQAELDAWFARKGETQAYKSGGHKLKKSNKRPHYTLIKPIGNGTFIMDKKARLVIPPRFSLDDAPQGAQSYYRVREGDCWGTGGYYCKTRAQTANPSCFGRLPKEFDLHMLGTMEGLKDSPVRVSGADTKQLDIYVASTPRPVVLAIGAMHPTTWAFHLDPGANIAAVLVSGNKRQAISGLPASVQSRFTNEHMVPNECGNGYASHMASDLDGWSRDLRAIFGRDVTEHQAERITNNFEVGGDFNIPEPQSHAFFGAYDNKGVVPQLDIDYASLRYSIAPASESGTVAGIKEWLVGLLSPKTMPYLIGFVLLIRPVINLFQRFRGGRTFGAPLAPRSVSRSYFQGMAVTAAGFSAGIMAVDQHPILQQTSLPLIMVVLLAFIAAPVVRIVYAVIQSTNLEIGLACIATGAAVACGAAFVMTILQGWDPSLLLAPIYGALGGLEFWRARRYPGATEKGTRIATLLSFFGGEGASDTIDTSQANRVKTKRRIKELSEQPDTVLVKRARAKNLDGDMASPTPTRRATPSQQGRDGGFGRRPEKPAQ